MHTHTQMYNKNFNMKLWKQVEMFPWNWNVALRKNIAWITVRINEDFQKLQPRFAAKREGGPVAAIGYVGGYCRRQQTLTRTQNDANTDYLGRQETQTNPTERGRERPQT